MLFCSRVARRFAGRFVHDLPYERTKAPGAPDYRNDVHWGALPDRDTDASDVLPEGLEEFDASTALHPGAAIFFIHPTIYTDDPKSRFPWNASLDDARLNERVDETTLRMQASVFTGAGDVYAPRYRQAHISAYYTQDSTKASAAFDTAYADVRQAFLEFLRRKATGRPIIIAGHSQGTTHGKRLVKEFFDGTPLQDSLVAAYLIGIPVEAQAYAVLKPCTSATQTSCLVSWRTWQRPAAPWNRPHTAAIASPSPPYPIVTNPLSWRTDTAYVAASHNLGGTLRKLRLVDQLADAQVYRGILWINRPAFFGKRFIRMANWHAADLNLYYANIYHNARARTAEWHARHR